MREHKIFKEIFSDDRILAEEFAKLFVRRWQPPENLAMLPKKSEKLADVGPKTARRA